MKYKIIFIIVITFLGCSSAIKNDSTGIYKRTNAKNIKNNFSNKYKGNMLYLDSRNPILYNLQIKEAHKLFNAFGNSLRKDGILLEITNKKKNTIYIESRRLFDKIQKKLNTNYTYNDAPFLIFYRKNNNEYSPYDILSFSNIPNQCLDESLSLIEQEIVNGDASNPYNLASSINELLCVTSPQIEKKWSINIHKMIKYLKAWLKNIE